MKWASLFLCLLACVGCRSGREAQVDDIARLFVSLRMESRTWEGQPERARVAREKLLRGAGMTLPEWRRRVAALQSDPNLWIPFWKRVEQISDSTDTKPNKQKRTKGS